MELTNLPENINTLLYYEQVIDSKLYRAGQIWKMATNTLSRINCFYVHIMLFPMPTLKSFLWKIIDWRMCYLWMDVLEDIRAW